MGTRGLRRVAQPLFLIAIILFVVPAIDVVARQAPIDWYSPRWRFSFAIAIAEQCFLPLIGLGLAALVSSALDDRRALGFVSIVSTLMAYVLMMTFIELAGRVSSAGGPNSLDWLGSNPTDARMWTIRSAVVFIACVWIAVTGFRGFLWKAAPRGRGRVVDPGEVAPVIAVLDSRSRQRRSERAV
jgi:hypothetical protein